MSIKNVKNWAKSQKNDFDVKIAKKRLLFEGCCAKIHYCQADVRQNEILQKRRQTERFDRIKNESQKSFKKCLTTYHESDKIIKLSATKAEAHRTLKIEQYRKNL
ncbi:hypothetical protein CGS59_02260 [Faecalibacterium prausnitzii]|uniref:Uncharacterized protein n=1 Tax=Faecalibacterium prausnitzii TaxID=853 RepID=A0A2A7B0D7_9FIRM|nr:hypothetical protein [Faecalibacterium prausnitzii]PDX84863.1 hypothetical protein CGS59_02260 [Faecalibacterium prausnitzii]